MSAAVYYGVDRNEVIMFYFRCACVFVTVQSSCATVVNVDVDPVHARKCS